MYTARMRRLRRDKYLMNILLVAGKKTLTRKWLSPESPILNAWMDTTMDIYKMETITASVNHRLDQFALHWENWISYLTPSASVIKDIIWKEQICAAGNVWGKFWKLSPSPLTGRLWRTPSLKIGSGTLYWRQHTRFGIYYKTQVDQVF